MAKRKSRFPSYGLVRGASHAQGGVAGMVAGEQPVELEGGEWIIPKEAVPDYLPVLKQITNEGRAMQQMDNGNTAIDALMASASMETGLAQPKSPMYQGGGQLQIRKEEPKLPYQDGAPYVGADKIDDLINVINSMSASQVGSFGQALSPVSYYGMPEAGRLSESGEKQLSDAGYAKYAGDEEQETSTKAAIMHDLFQRGQYKNDLDAFRGDFLQSDVRDISPNKQQGGPVDSYEGGGQLHSRRMYNQKDEDKYGYRAGGPMKYYQDGGKVGFEQITDLAKLYGKKQGIEFNPEYYTPEGGRSREGYGAKYNLPEGFTIDTLQYASPSNYSLQFNDPEGERLGTAKSAGVLDILGDIQQERMMSPKSPNLDMSEYFKQREEDMKLENMFGQLTRQATLEYPKGEQREQGGPVKQYQQGGQIQPRKQQEIRNPEAYGPPVPADIDSLLNQLMMRDVNQSINPFSGDTLDFEEDSLRLLGRMKKSHMPTYGRKKMQQGGPVGGQLGEGQPLERRPSPSEQLAQLQGMEVRPQDSLMGAAGQDGRIQAIPPDKYIIKDGTMSTREMEIPKLSPAYLQSFGLETPLSKRQNDLLRHRALSPETIGINPQVQSLFGKALIQRLTNEPL